MIDLDVLRTLMGFTASVVAPIVKADAKTRAKWKKAVSNLQHAVLETQLYVSALDRGGPADRTVERSIVDLWRVAASEFYGLDGGLAERLQLKAQYWTQPEAWTTQQVRDAGIALQHVAEYTRQLLYEGK